MLGLYLAGGLLTYVLGIFGISYVYGRLNPNDWEMHGGIMFLTTIWPVTAILALPIGALIGLIFGIIWVASYCMERGQAPVKARLAEERRQREIGQQIDRIDMFEDVPDNFFHENTETTIGG